ncbi:MAG: hypothetical protein JO047_04805 [Alphaproteobacteria bacterium]|nr:hypothetical protein [Alphaproteobacteria bacterium]
MQTPTGRIVSAAQELITVIDAQGRKLAVRRLDAVGKLRLFKALGPALAQNEPYLGMALLASSVSSIDDVPCPAAVNEMLIENTVRQLGEIGLAAVAQALRPEDPLDLDATKN